MYSQVHTSSTLKSLLYWTMPDPWAMENEHLLYCVGGIVFEHKGQHIIAHHFDSSNNDCRPCQYSVLLMS